VICGTGNGRGTRPGPRVFGLKPHFFELIRGRSGIDASFRPLRLSIRVIARAGRTVPTCFWGDGLRRNLSAADGRGVADGAAGDVESARQSRELGRPVASLMMRRISFCG
jgi:hypothetical protein